MEALKAHHTRLTKIGNSQTIRIPKKFVDYFFPDSEVILEPMKDGLLIIPQEKKISYKKAAIEMIKENEKWEDWDTFNGAGIDELGEW